MIGLFILGPPDAEVTPGQVILLKDALANTKEKLVRLATDHRDLHGTVSKVGKAIDRNFVPDYTATNRLDLLQSESMWFLIHTSFLCVAWFIMF